METSAKLNLLKGFYILHDLEGNILATCNQKSSIGRKLSKKNCQAIECGYDLDELISKADTSHLAKYTSDSHELMFDEGFKLGVKSIFEILGNKKFSERDMFNAYNQGGNDGVNVERIVGDYDDMTTINDAAAYEKECKAEFIKSLQKTEWDVYVEMECREERQCSCESNESCLDKKTKLDSHGCLILKQK